MRNVTSPVPPGLIKTHVFLTDPFLDKAVFFLCQSHSYPRHKSALLADAMGWSYSNFWQNLYNTKLLFFSSRNGCMSRVSQPSSWAAVTCRAYCFSCCFTCFNFSGRNVKRKLCILRVIQGPGGFSGHLLKYQGEQLQALFSVQWLLLTESEPDAFVVCFFCDCFSKDNKSFTLAPESATWIVESACVCVC